MVTVTPQAAVQIRTAAVQSNAIGLPLRIAIETKTDGSFHYLMGFDDQQQTGDQVIQVEDVSLVIAGASQERAQGMILDFVELEGVLEFIFINPNDPHYRPPQG